MEPEILYIDYPGDLDRFVCSFSCAGEAHTFSIISQHYDPLGLVFLQVSGSIGKSVTPLELEQKLRELLVP